MQVGEVWAYRERAAADLPLIPAEILQFGPPRSQKVRVRWKGGEYEGLDEWIPRVRLRVLWAEAEAWLRDEQLFDAVWTASIDALDTLEHQAAWLATSPAGDDLWIGPDRSEGAILRLADLNATAEDLGLDAHELLAEPLAFVNRHGEYIAPWTVAKRVAQRFAQRHAHRVLAKVAEDETELQEQAVHGHYFTWSRAETHYIPAEKCAEWLREKEPVFDLVRAWCGAPAVERFNELKALHAEVQRLRQIVEGAARRLEEAGLGGAARQLLRELNKRTPS